MKTGSTRISLETAANVLINTERKFNLQHRCHAIATALLDQMSKKYNWGVYPVEWLNELVDILDTDEDDDLIVNNMPSGLTQEQRDAYYWNAREKNLNIIAEQYGVKVKGLQK